MMPGPPPLGAAAIIQGTALHLPLADESVDLVVTSPPYFGLRSYTDQGEPLAGQLGSEPTPAEFLQALWAATVELKRVLKPGGSIFVNLGDAYYSGKGEPTQPDEKSPARRPGKRALDGPMFGVQRKSLTLLPEAYRLGCTGMLAQLGGPDPGLNLICRSVIVWAKPNGLPESVKDRVRRSHEDWVHLVKSPRYYSALDEIREPHKYPGDIRPEAWRRQAIGTTDHRSHANPSPLGKLPGSVWSIPSEPLRLPLELGIDHYAAFPSEWPRRLILGFSPPGICLECGEGRVPVVDKRLEVDHVQRRNRTTWHDTKGDRATRSFGVTESATVGSYRASILGYACACTPSTGLDGWTPPPTRQAVILDPFAGTGTTVLTARALGRYGVGVDLSFDYCRAAAWRVWDGPGVQKVRDRTWPPPPKPRRKPARRPGEVVAFPGQLTLLPDEEATG